MFGIASLLTPFLLGAILGATATGGVRVLDGRVAPAAGVGASLAGFSVLYLGLMLTLVVLLRRLAVAGIVPVAAEPRLVEGLAHARV